MSKDVADAIRYAAKWLGTGDAASTMGALEFVGASIKEAAETIAAPFHEIAEQVEYVSAGLGDIARALNRIAKALGDKEIGEDE